MRFKRFIGAMLAISMCMGFAIPLSSMAADQNPNNTYVPAERAECVFTDCTNYWARNEIEIMQLKSVINGKTSTLYAPEDNITRAEFLALVTRAVGVEPVAFADAYADVKDKWYASTVQAAANLGIINQGMIADGKFEGDKPITREEMTSLIAAGYKLLTGADAQGIQLDKFADKDSISAWATEDVQKAFGLGIIKGITETAFEPKLNATRAQAAVMIYRLMNYGKKIYKEGFDSNIDKWLITGDGKFTAQWDANEGVSNKGSLYFDIEYTGKNNSSIQWAGSAASTDGTNLFEKERKYIVSFSAKLDGANAMPINVIRARKDGGGPDYTTRAGTAMAGNTWNRYYVLVNGVDTTNAAAIVFTAGGCKQSDIKLWIDDIVVEEYIPYSNVSVDVADGLDSVVNITGDGKYPEYDNAEIIASSKAGQDYLLDSWYDSYGNTVDQNSYFANAATGDISLTAKFKPYKLTDKGYNVAPGGEKIGITMTKPVISGTTATASAKVTVPEGYKVAEAGILFYDECHVDNFNIFTENTKNVPADTLASDGSFTVSVSDVKETDDVLARAYAIFKDQSDNAYVQYSQKEIIRRRAGQIKPYRLINNHEMMQNFTASGTDPYIKGEADHYIDIYAGTDVEMMTITPSLYRTNTWPSEVDTQWMDYVVGEADTKLGGGASVVPVIMDYLKSGGDPLQEMIDVTRKNNFDVFINQRMNDGHNIATPTSATHNRFYRNNPDYRLKNSTSGNGVLNYMVPEVRDYYFALVEELVTKYDVDGLELDFERAATYFYEQEVKAGTSVMTDFVGRIRAMLDRVGEQKGKYLPLSVRICKSVSKSNSIGLDVEKWDDLGYIDMFNITQHYYNTTEIDVESYMNATENARIMAELNYLTREVNIDGKKMRQFIYPETVKATAANMFARGVDGISLFNMNYAGDQEQLCRYGFVGILDSEALAKSEKLYSIAPNQGIFSATGKVEYTLLIPDDTKSFGSAIMRVETRDPSEGEKIDVYINDIKLNEITREGDTELFERGRDSKKNAFYPAPECLRFYEVPLSVLKQGDNKFYIECTSNPKVVLYSTDLAIYK